MIGPSEALLDERSGDVDAVDAQLGEAAAIAIEAARLLDALARGNELVQPALGLDAERQLLRAARAVGFGRVEAEQTVGDARRRADRVAVHDP